MYDAAISSESDQNMRTVYFEMILAILKSSGYEREYNNLVLNVIDSIDIDQDNLKFYLLEIEDERYNEIADKVYFVDLINDIEIKYFNWNKFYNKDNSDYLSFYDALNEKYFYNTLESKDIEYFIDNFNIYNIDIDDLFSSENINKTAIKEFNDKFLINYDHAINVEDLVNNIGKNNKSFYSVFIMINDLCTALRRDYLFKFTYDLSDKSMEKLDIDSFYENSKSISVVIYNLIYNYYTLIYETYKNTENSKAYKTLYRFDGNTLRYKLKFDDTLTVLEDTLFYSNIYNPIIYLNERN